MPKMKTNKSVTKRVKVRRSGKVNFKKPGAGHLMSGKSGSRCRKLRRQGSVPKATAAKLRQSAGG